MTEFRSKIKLNTAIIIKYCHLAIVRITGTEIFKKSVKCLFGIKRMRKDKIRNCFKKAG